MNRRTRGRGEQGTVAAWSVAVVALLLAVALVLTAVAAAQRARRQLATAADLGALAGAAAAQRHRDACGAATAVARRNGATSVRCRRVRDEVLLEVGATVRLLGQAVAVSARARAGPVSATQQGVEEHDGPLLVEGLVAVPALR